MTKQILALITLVCLTSSCSLYCIDSIDNSEAAYPSKWGRTDVVYLEKIDQPHEEIGTVIVNGERKQRSIDDVIVKMKREAAIIGGDAITNIQSDATGVWKRLPAQHRIGNAYVRANYSATVAVFK